MLTVVGLLVYALRQRQVRFHLTLFDTMRLVQFLLDTTPSRGPLPAAAVFGSRLIGPP
jgi:hypothetical protein